LWSSSHEIDDNKSTFGGAARRGDAVRRGAAQSKA
jgi:hypothetical protein